MTSQDDEIICKWFNNRVSTKEDSVKLYKRVEKIIESLYNEGKVDDVTRDEWLDIVSASVNYDVSKLMVEIENKLTNIAETICTVSPNFKLDNVSTIDENGNRFYLLEYAYDSLFNYEGNFDNKTLEEIMGAAVYQADYVFLVKKFLEIIQESAESKIKEIIKEWVVYCKKENNLNKATDIFGASDHLALVSRRRNWFNKVHKYLIDNPEICEEIEKDTEINNIVDFFDVKK